MSSDKKRGKKNDLSNEYVYERIVELKDERKNLEDIAKDPEKYLNPDKIEEIVAEEAFRAKIAAKIRAQKEEEERLKTIELIRQEKAESYSNEKIGAYRNAIDNLDGLLEKRIASGEYELKKVKEWLIDVLKKELDVYHDFFYKMKFAELEQKPRETYKKTLGKGYMNVLEIIVETKEDILNISKSEITNAITKDFNRETRDKSLYRTIDSVFENYFKLCEEIEKEYRVIDNENLSEIKAVSFSEILQDSKEEWFTYMMSLLKPLQEEAEKEKAVNEVDSSYIQ